MTSARRSQAVRLRIWPPTDATCSNSPRWCPVSHPTSDFDSPGAQFQNRNVYFNGMRQDANNWLIDGILLVSPSQDALQEFSSATSNYAADLGNSSGAMTSMAVKSGTKRFYRSAWEFDRNDALDVYSYLSKQASNPTKTVERMQYATSLPIISEAAIVPHAVAQLSRPCQDDFFSLPYSSSCRSRRRVSISSLSFVTTTCRSSTVGTSSRMGAGNSRVTRKLETPIGLSILRRVYSTIGLR